MCAWRRPYRDAFRVYTGFIAVAGTVFALVVATMIATHWRSGRVLPVAGVGGFLGVWLTLAWRLHRTALLVGDAGVRVRWLLRTRTIPWSRVSRFRTAPDVLVRERLWIVLIDGRMVRTPVQRASGVFGSVLSDGGTWLRGSRYDTLLDALTGEMRSHGVTPGG
ncbi:hypothetical protein [Paractinoplanes toevensis]|uniref:hypothetical protein n=1 Tax=Paractinoplanes toevensis TaxID=571911 RepID=UPI001FE57102|nr:hypothetical protein [Actinoplanes toevensis]